MIDSDPEGPLTWISKQHNVNEIGLTESPPASGYRLWWITGHWEVADLAGIDINESREFDNPQALYNELVTGTNTSESSDQVMIALTEPLLELFFSETTLSKQCWNSEYGVAKTITTITMATSLGSCSDNH